MIALAKKEGEIGILDAGDVLDACVIRVPKTYPAYFGAYDRFDEMRNYTDSFENLFLVGRNGMHKYNNQDHSMLTAMTAVDNIANAGIADKSNLWNDQHRNGIPRREICRVSSVAGEKGGDSWNTPFLQRPEPAHCPEWPPRKKRSDHPMRQPESLSPDAHPAPAPESMVMLAQRNVSISRKCLSERSIFVWRSQNITNPWPHTLQRVSTAVSELLRSTCIGALPRVKCWASPSHTLKLARCPSSQHSTSRGR
jgi:hypothetical protein